MQIVKQFFINIERTDIDESMQNLVSEDIIDSIDIMALVA
ncbi:acyl carrier protein, partial [Campylobacter sp. RM12910]|nr:acyl carrier protein [Campylobacter sp. RM12910]